MIFMYFHLTNQLRSRSATILTVASLVLASILSVTALGCIAQENDEGDSANEAKSDEHTSTTEAAVAVLEEGFYQTAQTSGKVLAVYNRPTAGQNGYYCWVFDPIEMDALKVANGGSGVGSPWAFTPHLNVISLSDIAYRRYGSESTYCPWPSGMIQNNYIVELVQSATYYQKGTECHIISQEQIDHHGGWGVVWHYWDQSRSLNGITLGATYTGDCTW